MGDITDHSSGADDGLFVDAAAGLEGRLELLEAVVVNANDAVVVTASGEAGDQKIVFVNPAFTTMTGYEFDEVVNRHPRLLVGPRTDLETQNRLRAAVERRVPTRVELLQYRKDGSTFWVENSVSPISAGERRVRYIVSVQRDITDRKQSEDALRLSEERLEALLVHTEDIITVLEADGTVRYSNPAAGERLGLTTSANGTSAMELVHHEDRDVVVAALRSAVMNRGSTERVEFRLRYADGEWHHVEAFANNCLDEPSVHGIVVTLHDITERKLFEGELSRRALHDQLTGLPNRALLLDRLQHALDATARSDSTVAVLFMDLDRFKLLNDSMGHHAGDELLGAVAARLQASVRPGDTVARFGGDEFVVLCPEVSGPLQAEVIAERVLAGLEAPFDIGGAEVYAGASIGVSLPGDDSADPASLVRDADAAMYRAKDLGRGRVELFDGEMRARSLKRLRFETELRRATERNEFVVHYQPQVAINDGRLIGMEALVRWQHPELDLVPPGSFIPIAEDNGLIIQIGAWVLREACRWRVEAPVGDETVIWVNVAARQISHPRLVDVIASALADSGLPASALGVEITESGLMAEDGAIETLRDLKEVGIRIALDDFGTGYSSLGYLTRLPVDTLKVDQSFVARLGGSADAVAVLQAVLGLGRSLGLDVVAEGVETEEQLRTLGAMGCFAAQGFHIARPWPGPAAFDEITRRWPASRVSHAG